MREKESIESRAEEEDSEPGSGIGTAVNVDLDDERDVKENGWCSGGDGIWGGVTSEHETEHGSGVPEDCRFEFSSEQMRRW